ncbi:hypothetical protein D9M69_605380 [compost metagenome]
MNEGSAAGGSVERTVAHRGKASAVVRKPVGVCQQGCLENVANPRGQIGIEPVIHPLPLATVEKQATAAKLGKVAGNFGLTVVQGADQLTHA